MTFKKWNRAHLRAPFYRKVILNNVDELYMTRGWNLGQGGILVIQDIKKAEGGLVELLFDVPDFPYLDQIETSKIKYLNTEDLPRNIIKVAGKMVRANTFENESGEKYKRVGYEFFEWNPLQKEIVVDYVEKFSRNISFALNHFENTVGRKDITFLRSMAKFFGYSENERISVLHQKILSDYRSLEES